MSMRLPDSEHTNRPWRIHEIAPDFQVQDVWAFRTPGAADIGHRVERAGDAAAALAALEQEPADLVLVDWQAVDGGADALCRSIRGRPGVAGTHIVALVAVDRGERVAGALEAGADDWLSTPFERTELEARVRVGLRTTQLHASEARLRALIDNVPGAIYRCSNDADWTMELISEEIERISGYPAVDFIQNACRSFASVIHPDDRDDVARAIADAIADERPFALEYRIVRADGGVVWVLERGQLVRGNDGRVWLDGAIFDITERRRAEETLREREAERARLEEVRASRARIVEAADAARRRLERDLHDGAQQHLVALALNLRFARSQAEARPEATVDLLDEALADAQRATDDLRELARGLHPAVLTDRGLGPALQLLADRAPIPVELSADIPTPLPGPVEIAAYFVASEALTNVVKHAGAAGAMITVARHDGTAVVEVADDGVGGVETSNGSGLRDLEDRVGALDGRLEVESRPGAGTLVRAAIPCA
jgi:PAS domain S-box-containing protein